jgi:hypothetical protein
VLEQALFKFFDLNFLDHYKIMKFRKIRKIPKFSKNPNLISSNAAASTSSYWPSVTIGSNSLSSSACPPTSNQNSRSNGNSSSANQTPASARNKNSKNSSANGTTANSESHDSAEAAHVNNKRLYDQQQSAANFLCNAPNAAYMKSMLDAT